MAFAYTLLKVTLEMIHCPAKIEPVVRWKFTQAGSLQFAVKSLKRKLFLQRLKVQESHPNVWPTPL